MSTGWFCCIVLASGVLAHAQTSGDSSAPHAPLLITHATLWTKDGLVDDRELRNARAKIARRTFRTRRDGMRFLPRCRANSDNRMRPDCSWPWELTAGRRPISIRAVPRPDCRRLADGGGRARGRQRWASLRRRWALGRSRRCGGRYNLARSTTSRIALITASGRSRWM